ncbi:MAG: TetR/AcrR family transcriptional regulator [Candidatus Competibacteraceae bacterium]|jgi:AcrR family transcriptional regulator|nr:TetR/AcrR family transcriptional regulator [Candidatus Competibacteraceae bacterium]
MSEINKSSPPIRLDPKPALRIQKSELTRTAILNAGLEFVWSHPFRDMTVNSLMASTGLSRSAFYQYFKDLHDLMQALLDMLRDEVFAVTGPWFQGNGDPIALLNESLAGLVDVCYRLGPILKATDDAAASDELLEKAWNLFKKQFDDAVTARIEADQEQGLITNFDARPVAIALNRLDAYTLIEAFGQRPRSKKEPVLEALTRTWVSTLYGSELVGNKRSGLVRT